MSNYTKNQYIDDKNNSWSIVFDLIKNKETILDIGCSSGNFGAGLIARKHCTVDGIDIDPKDVKLASQKLRNAQVIDIERDPLTSIKEKYDVILMMDVIEHLVDPVVALQKVSRLLAPGGRLIFSVPNMAHVSVRLDLLLGSFKYREVGLLDHTHLHFYTEKTLLEVLRSAGFAVTKTASSTVSYPEKLLKSRLGEAGLQPSPKFMKKLVETKGNVYQFVGVAQLTNTFSAKSLTFPATNPHEVHFEQAEAATKTYYEEMVADMKRELNLKDQHIANIEAELATIRNSKVYKVTQKAVNARHKLKSQRSNRRG